MGKDTVTIHGKEYETVASRVARFRDTFTFQYSIETTLVERDNESVVMKAIITDLTTDKVVATGYAEEKRNASTINKTSALENCETSAIGRALAAFGIAGTEYASADEVAQAINQQMAPKPSIPKRKLADRDDIQLMLSKAKDVSGLGTKDEVLDWFNKTLQCLPTEVPKSDVQEILDDIEAERAKVHA